MASETVDLILDFEAQRAVREMQSATDALRDLEQAEEGIVGGAKRAQGSLDDLGGEAQRTARSLREIEDGAGDTDSVLQGLAGALDVVNPKLGDAARTAGDLSGGFEAVLRAVGRIPIAFGVAGAAVAALAGIYAKLAGDIQEANKAQREAAQLAAEAQQAAAPVVAARVERRFAAGDIGAEQAVAELTAAGFTDERTAQIEEQRDRVLQTFLDLQEGIQGLTQTQIENARQGIGVLDTVADVRAFDTAKARLDQLNTLIATAGANAARELVASWSQAIEEETQNGGGAPSVPGVQEAVDAIDFTNLGRRTVEVIDALAINAANDIAEEFQKAQTRASQAALSVRQQAELGLLSPEELGRTGFDLGSAIGELPGITPSGLGVGDITRLATGDVTPLLSALGPAGLAAGTVAGGLQQLGAIGAEGAGDRVEQFLEGIAAGIEELPELFDALLEGFLNGLDEIIDAFISNLPDIIIQANLAAVELLLAGIAQIPAQIAASIAEALGATVADIGEGGFLGLGGLGESGGRNRAAIRGALAVATLGLSEAGFAIGAFQEGGRVDSTGLALVHRGEMIIPSSGAGSSTATRAAQQLGGGGINVDLRGALVGRDAGNEILRLLEETVGPGGLGSTSIDFNGAVGI